MALGRVIPAHDYDSDADDDVDADDDDDDAYTDDQYH